MFVTRHCVNRGRYVAPARAQSGPERARSRKGDMFENDKRRKGRPAWQRNPYDSPLRDGNRDRLIGLLTERAAKTLLCYLMETNLNVYHWLTVFLKENPIPKNGAWDDVSGETFLRKLLSMPVDEAKWNTGRDSMYDCVQGIGVDPRNIAQRIMDIRAQLAKEFVQDLSNISEENSLLLRETLLTSLTNSLPTIVAPGAEMGVQHPELLEAAPIHPEMLEHMQLKDRPDLDKA